MITVGPSESMSKSKKNTIDPEDIISNYGADAARLFILSDSPPEKDVQWSEEGIVSSYKFIQKLWILNSNILEEIKKNHEKDFDNEIIKFTNRFLKNVTKNLENFSYNKIIANLHEMHTFFSKQVSKGYTKKTLIDNYKKVLIASIPVTPHLSNECLELMNVKDKNWPSYDETFLKEKFINIVIQVNGKKRGIIKTEPDISEENLLQIVNNDEKIVKHLNNNIIKKKIYIKNKLLNVIV